MHPTHVVQELPVAHQLAAPVQAQMSGMGEVPDVSPEQLREASARMATMTPEDLARTADLAQAQGLRNGPSTHPAASAPAASAAPSNGPGLAHACHGMLLVLLMSAT